MTTFDAVLALPTADRVRAHAFYAALGFATPGRVAEDGEPEPLQVVVNDRFRLMLIPTGGFGWVTSGREVARRGTVECLLSVAVRTPADVDALLATARLAGAEIASPAEPKPWGYTGSFADPDGHLWEATAPPS
jgi:predicted lactoylglutathione lyase